MFQLDTNYAILYPCPLQVPVTAEWAAGHGWPGAGQLEACPQQGHQSAACCRQIQYLSAARAPIAVHHRPTVAQDHNLGHIAQPRAACQWAEGEHSLSLAHCPASCCMSMSRRWAQPVSGTLPSLLLLVNEQKVSTACHRHIAQPRAACQWAEGEHSLSLAHCPASCCMSINRRSMNRRWTQCISGALPEKHNEIYNWQKYKKKSVCYCVISWFDDGLWIQCYNKTVHVRCLLAEYSSGFVANKPAFLSSLCAMSAGPSLAHGQQPVVCWPPCAAAFPANKECHSRPGQTPQS